MGDRLQVGKLSRYVTSHPGQLSLAIPLWVIMMSTSLGWEGNHRSGVALAMRHRHSGLSTYGLNGLWKGDEHPAYAPSGVWPCFTFIFTFTDRHEASRGFSATAELVVLLSLSAVSAKLSRTVLVPQPGALRQACRDRCGRHVLCFKAAAAETVVDKAAKPATLKSATFIEIPAQHSLWR